MIKVLYIKFCLSVLQIDVTTCSEILQQSLKRNTVWSRKSFLCKWCSWLCFNGVIFSSTLTYFVKYALSNLHWELRVKSTAYTLLLFLKPLNAWTEDTTLILILFRLLKTLLFIQVVFLQHIKFWETALDTAAGHHFKRLDYIFKILIQSGQLLRSNTKLNGKI